MSTVLTKAVEAARAGQYETALVSLEELGGQGSDDPRVLDLLARVHAQRGEFADADSCWSRAQSLDPSLQAAVAGRRRIAALQARRVRPRVLPVAVAVVAVVAGVGVLLPATDPPAPPSPPDLSGLDEVAARQDQLSRDLAALRDSLAAPAQRFDHLVAALASPRFTVTRQGSSALVTFNDGLFSRDARLSTSGRSALAELGQTVKPFPASISVIGHGSTVDLGFRRAQVAAAELGAPLSSVNLRSAGSTQLPYPAGSRRNNTVTVLVEPHEGLRASMK
jgi:hypothetical protein